MNSTANTSAINSDDNSKTWTISKENKDSKVYTYDEAVNLTGHGPYSLLLLLAAFFSVTGMVLDLFSFPIVASVASCDLQLDTYKEKILFSLPFIGPVIGAYPIGYLSDTRGRRLTMLTATWVGFISAFLAAISPHWVVIGILKIISAGCCCISIAYTLIGECCSVRVKNVYSYFITCAIHLAFPVQMALQYFALTLTFSFNLGVINFLPWRLLAIIFALPLVGCAICLHFLYESPKYLVNAGKEAEAVDNLAKMWKRNRQSGNEYPVKTITLNEEIIIKTSDVPLWQSLMDQIVPIFKMPLLLRSLQLYYLVIVIYGSCGGLLIWFPYLVDAFISGSQVNETSTGGLCNMITRQSVIIEADQSIISCTPKSSLTVVWAALAQALVLTVVTCSVGLFRKRRKLFMITVLLIPGLAALGCATLNNVASLVAYFCISLAVVGVGTLMTYFVDLFPTSYRGMASSLSIMIARFSNIISINIVGSLFRNHCNATFSLYSAVFLSGAVLACFLPSDKKLGLK